MKRIVLILAGLAALVLVLVLAVPALVDWGRYKGHLEARLEEATGRDVDIAGKVGLRLLPHPAFAAERVSIGNLPEAGDAPMAAVARLSVRLALLPLLKGDVEVTSLVLERPELHLVRLADGRTNWSTATPEDAPGGDARPAQPQPQARPALKGEPPPDEPARDVVVEDLRIVDGTLTYAANGSPPVRLSAIDALVRIGGAKGPFSAQGEARFGDARIGFDAALDRLSPGKGSPLSLELRQGPSRLAFSGLLSHLSEGPGLRGRLIAQSPDLAAALAALDLPAPIPAATSLDGGADIVASAEHVEAAPLELELGGTRATGAVAAALGRVPQIDAELKIAALDLDKWTRAAAPPPPVAQDVPPPARPQPGQPQAATTPGRAQPGGFALPAEVMANLSLAVETLSWRGQVVRQTQLDASLAEGEVMVRRLSAQLPGGTGAALEGSLSARKGEPYFEGSLRARSDQPRTLLAWLEVPVDALPQDSLRQLDLTTPLRVAWPVVGLDDFRLRLDGKAASGRLQARLARPVEFDLATRIEPWGPIAAAGRIGETVDIKAEAFGGSAQLSGTLGAAPRLHLAARHPDTVQMIRRWAADWRPRGPLGALAVDGELSRDGARWRLPRLTISVGDQTLSAEGSADLSGPRPRVDAQVNAGHLVVDPFLAAERRTGFLLPGSHRLPPVEAPAPVTATPTATGAPGNAPWSREPLDLGALESFDGRIALAAQSVTASGWRLDTPRGQVVLNGGTATLEQFTGRLLDGELNAAGSLRAGKPNALSARLSIAGARLGQAQLGFGDYTLTQGRLEAEADLSASGVSTQDMANRLAGTGRLAVRDGVVSGFDLPAVSQRLNNIENVGSLLGLLQSGMSGGSTPFSALTGTFQARDGIIATRDLRLDAKGGGATGESTTDIARWTTATVIAIRLADSSAPPMLVRLEGPLGNPRKVIDVNAIQQHLVARGLGRALKNKEAGGLVEELLGGRLERPQNQPGNQPDGQSQPQQKPNGGQVLRELLKGLGGR